MTEIHAREISSALSRSWLLVSAATSRSFTEPANLGADQLVLDLEDAVDPRNKDAARTRVADWLREGGSAWVRVNDRSSAFWSDDIDELCALPGLRGFMLAKTESADQVAETFSRSGSRSPVLALVESALGIENATEIACAPGAFRLAFGSGDYRRDTGTSADALAMAYPRSRLVVASRVGGLPGPVDGPTVGSDIGQLRMDTALTAQLGLTGKLCLVGEHAAIVNDELSPSDSDARWAREFIADFEARDREVRDGSDLPRFGRARRIAALAEEFGVPFVR